MNILTAISLIQIIGLIFALTGAALGIAGAWFTSYPHSELRKRHQGFRCWVINSPLVILSLVGVALGIWQDLNVWCFIPMHAIYWFTAIRGWMNTKNEQMSTKIEQSDTKSVPHGTEMNHSEISNSSKSGEYTIVDMPRWDEK